MSEFHHQHTEHYIHWVGGAALCNPPTAQNTYDLALRCLQEGVSGDFVECGVYAGAQVALMHRACRDHGEMRKLHLFDSFCGIPEAGPKDDQAPGIGEKPVHHQGRLRSTGVSACSLNQVKQNFLNWRVDMDYCRFYEGWFQDTVPQARNNIPQIALLRLDGDLYESTKVCLESFYPRISDGGYCIIDDYALGGCNKAVNEYIQDQGLKGLFEIVEVEGGGGPVWWKVRRPPLEY